MSEPTTPRSVQDKLRYLTQEMEKAGTALKAARNEEVEAKQTWLSAKRRALLDPDRPRVERGGFTVAERDAWVDDQAADEHQAFMVAEAKRKAARDHLDMLIGQSMTVMALNKSVQGEVNMSGRWGS